ncbi:putative LOC100569746 [Trichonephila clavipes]|nr:putative LOC100569746 [Trichonephila clavipes]
MISSSRDSKGLVTKTLSHASTGLRARVDVMSRNGVVSAAYKYRYRLRFQIHELWFQQDGATCHTARATIDLLKDTFGDRLISRFGPVNWPPRSCDLTPLDYFLWGYVKSLVYADKPQTLDHLEDNIRRVIADIRPQMLEKVIENWTSRLDYIRASRDSHMPEIIFKM